MRENKLYISNKSFVVMKYSLLAVVLIGLVAFTVFNILPKPVHAEECPTVETLGGQTTPFCTSNEDCHEKPVDNPCTDDVCHCTTHCDHYNNNYQEQQPCGTGDCAGTQTRTCSGGSFGPWSDCSTKGKVCGNCPPGPDCVLDEFAYTIDVLLSGAWYCDKDGYCNNECVYNHYCLDNDYSDGGPYTFGCGAECDGYGKNECPDYCEGDTKYEGFCNLWPGDCTCDYNTYNCNNDDGCYPYENGCEDRNYFCSEEDSAFCDYTYSNRQIDYYDDYVFYCSDNQLKKHRLFHDFSCDETCADHTSWADDQVVEDCSSLSDQCNVGVCDAELKDCKVQPKIESTTCNDGLYCNGADHCDGKGSCVNIGPSVDCSNLNDQCNVGICSETNDRCEYNPKETSHPCNDGLWCNGPDHCDATGAGGLIPGVCVNIGPAVDCDDENECTNDICNETIDQCLHTHKDVNPPVTTKTYETPIFEDGIYDWVTSDTPITLTAIDYGIDQTQVCAKDVDKIYYRYCLKPGCYEECDQIGTLVIKPKCDCPGTPWMELTDTSFTIPQDSEHCIEYYAVDKLVDSEIIDKVNVETIKSQCVYVDNTPPILNKIVDEPNAKWDGKDSNFYPGIGDLCWNGQQNQIKCWKVTKETQITMSCEDQQPHPVGIKELCYKVDLDGNDATEDYCNTELTEGWCCIDSSTKNLVFKEDSEHELEFYCIDELDNMSPIDIEKFKVYGGKFDIQLNFKWNLVSVPFVLFSDDPKDVFENVKNDVLLVLTYDAEDPDCVANDGWCVYIPSTEVGTIKHIKSGWGYWVLTNKETTLTVVGSLLHEGETPPSRSVVKGWNLIGYYGTDGLTEYNGPVEGGRQAFCALHSLVNLYNSIPTEWDALITYWKGSFTGLTACNYMDPGAGYWIGMNVADSDYRYTTDCSGNTCD